MEEGFQDARKVARTSSGVYQVTSEFMALSPGPEFRHSDSAGTERASTSPGPASTTVQTYSAPSLAGCSLLALSPLESSGLEHLSPVWPHRSRRSSQIQQKARRLQDASARGPCSPASSPTALLRFALWSVASASTLFLLVDSGQVLT